MCVKLEIKTLIFTTYRGALPSATLTYNIPHTKYYAWIYHAKVVKTNQTSNPTAAC